MKKSTIYILLIATVVLTAFSYSDKLFDLSKNLNLYKDLYITLNKSYVDEVEPAQLMKEGLTAMLKDLDPYTNYITEGTVETAKLERFASGANIGAELVAINNDIVVKSVLQGLPADKVGVKPGDKILKIDRKSIEGKSLADIQLALKGEADSPLQITFLPFGKQSEEVKILYREEIKPQDVTLHQMLNDTVGYVKLSTFNARGCSNFVATAIKELKADGAKYLIFDLRDNRGGLLNESVNICNLFVDKGIEVVSSKGRFEQYNKSYVTTAEPLAPEMPTVVLINGISASASEIVSGTLQDLDRAVVVGEMSYGKGLVQQTKPIGYGAILKLTIAKYFLPTGRCIQAVDYYGDYTDKGASQIADSLKNAFTTPNGRTVYDNSGISPDVEVKPTEITAFVEALIKQNIIFDYTNLFQSRFDSIAPAKQFKFTDNDFDDFEAFAEKTNFNFESSTEKSLNSLNETLQFEKADESLLNMITQLEKDIQFEKQALLKENKAQIKNILQTEIIARYYYDKGKIESTLNSDSQINESIKLFSDMDAYYQILGI